MKKLLPIITCLFLVFLVSNCDKEETQLEKEISYNEIEKTILSVSDELRTEIAQGLASEKITKVKSDELFAELSLIETELKDNYLDNQRRANFFAGLLDRLIVIVEFLHDKGVLIDADYNRIIDDLTEKRCVEELFDNDKDGVNCDVDCDDNDADIYIGASCDDSNVTTINDKYDANCECKGITCTIGASCDDSIANTISEVYNEDCECEGCVFEVEGVWRYKKYFANGDPISYYDLYLDAEGKSYEVYRAALNTDWQFVPESCGGRIDIPKCDDENLYLWYCGQAYGFPIVFLETYAIDSWKEVQTGRFSTLEKL